MGEHVDPAPDDDQDDERARPAGTGPYPGRLDERMMTPSAPLAPGAAMRVIPVALEPFPGASVPATWAPDPTGRHQWRWWGGVAWTDHVADDGVTGDDPMPPG